MAAVVRISRKPTPAQISEIVAAAKLGDVVVVCPMAASMTGRKLMRERLCHAGLPPTVAAVLGWSTTAPGDDAPPVDPTHRRRGVAIETDTPDELIATVNVAAGCGEPDEPHPAPDELVDPLPPRRGKGRR